MTCDCQFCTYRRESRKRINRVIKLLQELWDAVHDLSDSEFKEVMETDFLVSSEERSQPNERI